MMDAKARQDCVKEIGLLKVSCLGLARSCLRLASLGWAGFLGYCGLDTLGLSVGQTPWAYLRVRHPGPI